MYAGSIVEDTADIAELKDEQLFIGYVLHRRPSGKVGNVTIQDLLLDWKMHDEITEDMADYLIDIYMYYKNRRAKVGLRKKSR